MLGCVCVWDCSRESMSVKSPMNCFVKFLKCIRQFMIDLGCHTTEDSVFIFVSIMPSFRPLMMWFLVKVELIPIFIWSLQLVIVLMGNTFPKCCNFLWDLYFVLLYIKYRRDFFNCVLIYSLQPHPEYELVLFRLKC